MFAVAAPPENAQVTPNATVAATFAPLDQFTHLESSLVTISLDFRRSPSCIFKKLQTLSRAHLSPCSLFSAPCTLFSTLFFEPTLCFQRLARSLLRSFACVQILSSVLSCGCALFVKNTREEGTPIPKMELPSPTGLRLPSPGAPSPLGLRFRPGCCSLLIHALQIS